MTRTPPDIPGLLGSRICHDLISPLGAIANGVELLLMTGEGTAPEVQLIDDSVRNATAKIRFFRVAYGTATGDQRIGTPDICDILQDMTAGSRLSIDWQPGGDLPRAEVKLAFLLIQCLETALVAGGRITVTARNSGWTLTAASERMRIDPDLWNGLATATFDEVGPAQVHFPLAAALSADLERQISIDSAADRIVVTV